MPDIPPSADAELKANESMGANKSLNADGSSSQNVEVLVQQLRSRWRAGDRVCIEEIDGTPHQAGQNDDVMLDLLYHEILIREEFGERPELDDFARRFPQLRDQLERLLAVHFAIDDDDWDADLSNLVNADDSGVPCVSDDVSDDGIDASPSTQVDHDLETQRALFPRRKRDCRTIEPPAGYELLDELGRGGMAVVYRARQIGLNRIVALKMVLGGSVASAETLARLEQEARAVAHLQHPGIVQIHEVGEHQGLPYLTLEYVRGGTLQEWLRGRPLAADEAARLIEELARTTAFAHEHGIVHRDLKPANVLLTVPPAEHETLTTLRTSGRSAHSSQSEDERRIKISDFGLARMTDSISDLTATGQVIGTPNYMAPEQAGSAGDPASPALDIYSLGAILYELLTGRPPFRGTTLFETLEQVRNNDPVPPRQLQPRVPRDIETICLKCLEKNPARRYATALELAADLHCFLNGDSISARPAGLLENLSKRIRRNPAVSALILLVILLIAGGQAAILNEAHRANLSEQAALADSRRADLERENADMERLKAEDAARVAEAARSEAEVARREAVVLQKETEAERARAVMSQAKADEALERTLKALNSVGEIGSALKSQPGVEHLGRSLLDKTLALYDELLQDQRDEPAVRSRRLLALISAGEIQRILNRYDRAGELLTEAATLIEPELTVPTPPSDFEQFHRGTRIWWNLAVMRKDQLKWADSLKAFEKTLSIHDAALRVQPDSYLHLVGRMNVLINTAIPLRNLYRIDDAAEILTQAIDAGRKIVAVKPEGRWGRAELALALHDHSMLIRFKKLDQQADAEFDESLAIRQKLFEQFPDNAVACIDMTRSWLDQAEREFNAGQFESALSLARQCETMITPLVERSPDVFEYHSRLLTVIDLRLRATIRLGTRSEIETALTELCAAITTARTRWPADASIRNKASFWLPVQAYRLLDLGNAAAAGEHFREAIAANEAILQSIPADNRLAEAINSSELGWLLGTCPVADLRQPERALQLVDRAVELFPANSHFHDRRGGVLMEAGRHVEAEETFGRSTELAEAGGDGGFSPSYRERLSYYRRLLRLVNRARGGDREGAVAGVKQLVGTPLNYSPDDATMWRYAEEAQQLVISVDSGQ